MVRGKSDKIDAKRIATYAMRHQDKYKLVIPPSQEIKMLRKLAKTRKRLLLAINKLSTPLQEKSLSCQKGIKSIRSWLCTCIKIAKKKSFYSPL